MKCKQVLVASLLLPIFIIILGLSFQRLAAGIQLEEEVKKKHPIEDLPSERLVYMQAKDISSIIFVK